MIYLVYLGNYLTFKFNSIENAVSFLEEARFSYFYGENPTFELQILSKKEFEEYEKKILQREEKIKVLKQKGMIK